MSNHLTNRQKAIQFAWLPTLKEGDSALITYDLSEEGQVPVTVVKNDGAWITVLPEGLEKNDASNYVIFCAASGIGRFYGSLVPPSLRKEIIAEPSVISKLAVQLKKLKDLRNSPLRVFMPSVVGLIMCSLLMIPAIQGMQWLQIACVLVMAIPAVLHLVHAIPRYRFLREGWWEEPDEPVDNFQDQELPSPYSDLIAYATAWNGQDVRELQSMYCDAAPELLGLPAFKNSVPAECRGTAWGIEEHTDPYNSLSIEHEGIEILAVDSKGLALVATTRVWVYHDADFSTYSTMPVEEACAAWTSMLDWKYSITVHPLEGGLHVAQVSEMSGAMGSGATAEEAMANAEALVRKLLEPRIARLSLKPRNITFERTEAEPKQPG